MKNILTAFLACLCVGLFSCQKEVDDIFAGNSNNSPELLTKIVAHSGSDSAVVEYSYNSKNQLIAMNNYGVDAGTPISRIEKFIRNGQGIITQIITKDADLASSGIDSVISKVNYNGGRYSSRVSVIDFFGAFIFKDSSAMSYDGTGNVVLVEEFLDLGLGTGYEPFLKTEYTYSGKNIAAVKTYSYDDASAAYVEEVVETYTYDSKSAPLVLGNDAFAIGNYVLYSANNFVKYVIVSSSDPTQSETEDVTYVYNSSNKPSSATAVIQGGSTATITYFYNK
jgi:hypothetical protein